MLSLYPILVSAFFVPGTRWEERLEMALLRVVFAACICSASGLIYSWPARTNPESGQPILVSLPVRLFFWAVTGMALLFAISWCLEEYYLPLTRHNCCRP